MNTMYMQQLNAKDISPYAIKGKNWAVSKKYWTFHNNKNNF